MTTSHRAQSQRRRPGPAIPQPDIPPPDEIPELEEPVRAILEQADAYDRNLFEAMGVKTIWVEDYDDIPALLDQISSPA